MPKASIVGRLRATAVASRNIDKSKPSSGGDESQLSRGQRKRMAKREQYLQREQMVLSSLKLKRQEDDKKRIDGMSAIRDALLETTTTASDNAAKVDGSLEPKTAHAAKSNKAKQELASKEVLHMSLVQQHPAFQADPFAALRQHLQNTLAKDAGKVQEKAAKYVKDREKKQQERKAIKKEQSMKKKKTKKLKATRSKSR